jgi:two-component system chemotaxis response regulator CheY
MERKLIMSCTVLLCDDAMFTRTMLKGILVRAGHVVVGEADNGRAAVEQYTALRPQLVLMDIVMPDMSGLEAVRAICRVDPDACIVMCSAMGQQELVEEAIVAGAIGFILKPFTASRVLETIADAGIFA